MLRRTVEENPWIPWHLTPPQAEFCSTLEEEGLYGGAAGGGKSIAMLCAAAQFVTHYGYSAILFRRNFPDLMQAGGLIPRAHEAWANTAAVWNEQQKTYTFPSGATIRFSFCDVQRDVYKYQGGEFQFIGFDELTQFVEPMYAYLKTRLRKPSWMNVPLRMRAASNPGGTGHIWVRKRFVRQRDPNPERFFIPARLEDNPHLDREQYRRTLNSIEDAVLKQQLRDGNWDVVKSGGVFDPIALEWQYTQLALWQKQNGVGKTGALVRRAA